MTRLTAILLVALSAAGLAGAAWYAANDDVAASQRAELPRIGQPFELTGHTGARIASSAFGDKALFIAFGYTSCPDICPTLLQTMSEVMDQLPAPLAAKVQTVFITVDPERDTPEVLASYLAKFHPRILGLTGSPSEIADVTESYHVYSGKVTSADAAPGTYMMEHASSLLLVSSDGRLLASFGFGRMSSDEVARMIGEVLR